MRRLCQIRANFIVRAGTSYDMLKRILRSIPMLPPHFRCAKTAVGDVVTASELQSASEGR